MTAYVSPAQDTALDGLREWCPGAEIWHVEC
jgi:hypothetical protein